ncbi:prepilin-type N-terminal cleavage/methylation domain-containing protein [Terrimicrobium sacchariphilum]|uniref:Prepilin-type N-terminal cleavage/methylation domain-containing protein n=1 Tax=Terrimicrobium sacchariphilum TaxID=690879 RepID=A0A146GFK8_TERSA|nr:prepilin-type N-terminal cleavage/methylation domain-containing protein [Terrimicrobium sacchariphilum]
MSVGRHACRGGVEIRRHSRAGFTIIEMLVAVAVFTMLLVLITMLFKNASALVTANSRRLDADTQARQLLDRLAVDLAQMLKRDDVDYFMKSSMSPQSGNDQMAFFSEVPGYFSSSSSSQSPMSLVAYRVNDSASSGRLHSVERLGKGLEWGGTSGSGGKMAFLPLTIKGLWPQAANNSADDDYEQLGTDIFRFEYFYLLQDGTLSTDFPKSINDVAGICVVVAVIDPKSRAIVSDDRLATLAGRMADFDNSMKTGELEKKWRDAIDTSDLPKAALSSVRVYGRTFYLNPLAL